MRSLYVGWTVVAFVFLGIIIELGLWKTISMEHTNKQERIVTK